MAFTRRVALLNTQAFKLLAGSTEVPGFDLITQDMSAGSTSEVGLVLDIDGDVPQRTYKLYVREGSTLTLIAQGTR